MSRSVTSYVVVGAGLAGAGAVRTLREEGFEGPVTLLGQEPHPPYERPALSKGYLQGTQDRDSVFVHPRQWYAEQGIELRTGATVVGVAPGTREVALGDGTRISYTALLLATGATPRHLPIPGTDLRGVLHLRTLDDAERLREAIGAARRVALVGGGWIGLEVAAAARLAGREVTVLEQGALPLVGVLGPRIAEVFAGLHREHGVDVRTGVRVESLLGAGGEVSGVRLADGGIVPADLVLVAVGASPSTALARSMGLAVDGGILVDASLRSSDPHVFAAGDVASAQHPVLGARIRVEHWANALHQGPAAARSMLGQAVTYDRLPYFYTDQYDLGMEYTGHVAPDTPTEVVLRGDLAAREFIAFWTSGERVLAAMAVNTWDTMPALQDLIASRRPVDHGRLADPGVTLDSL